MRAGISLDPAKGWFSEAGLLLTTEVMIADAPKDEADHAHATRAVAWATWASPSAASAIEQAFTMAKRETDDRAQHGLSDHDATLKPID